MVWVPVETTLAMTVFGILQGLADLPEETGREEALLVEACASWDRRWELGGSSSVSC